MIRAFPGMAVLALGILLGGPACEKKSLEIAVPSRGSLGMGLLAHWPFDEGSGNVAADISDGRRHATLTGATWVPNGRFGSAIRFAPNGYGVVDDFPDGTPSWTVSYWAYLATADLTGGRTAALGTEIITQGGWESNVFTTVDDLHFTFSYWHGPAMDDYAYVESWRVLTDTWQHIVGVADSEAETISIYVDGVMEETKSATKTILPGTPSLFFGRLATGERHFPGALDDIAIYERALSAKEVAMLMVEPTPNP